MVFKIRIAFQYSNGKTRSTVAWRGLHRSLQIWTKRCRDIMVLILATTLCCQATKTRYCRRPLRSMAVTTAVSVLDCDADGTWCKHILCRHHLIQFFLYMRVLNLESWTLCCKYVGLDLSIYYGNNILVSVTYYCPSLSNTVQNSRKLS